MNRDRRFEVHGGPSKAEVTFKNGLQTFPVNTQPFDPIRIVEVKRRN